MELALVAPQDHDRHGGATTDAVKTGIKFYVRDVVVDGEVSGYLVERFVGGRREVAGSFPADPAKPLVARAEAHELANKLNGS
jgi:hypothetical protein